ncbi:NAD-dependent epimerase/dehydratase family protein [Streptomyces sp. GS7]|uniref:NAD-dependent epimerase/dehydratase family protein n=1 Tax=Streptomyces sp. GS7 TaxID=2692234 RepID=UPI00131630F4|nr:NAD(P)-dependent oxidoreductase [Streptomyces sp. GS7]QHC20457.1 NAD-dependent epimerase/dehydratase family protein [Streptomyces sp. GS7]
MPRPALAAPVNDGRYDGSHDASYDAGRGDGAPGGPERTVVVLGGAGFLGRHICRAFGQLPGHRVLAVTRGPREPVPGAELVPLDVLTGPAEALHALVARADAVVNAVTDTWEGTEAQMTASHIPLLERLVRAVAAAPARPRLVQLGSVYEYGQVPVGTVIGEGHPADPVSPYARTKLAGTRMVLDATAEGRVDGCVLRISNVCGSGSPRRSFLGGLAERLRRAMADGTPVSLDVTEDRRDFIDVEDVAAAVVSAATAPVSGRVVNIGRGTAISVRELAWLLVAASGLPPHLVDERPAPAGATPAGGNSSSWTQVDIRTARELLGWSPRVPLEDSLHRQWTALLEGRREQREQRDQRERRGQRAQQGQQGHEDIDAVHLSRPHRPAGQQDLPGYAEPRRQSR